MSMERQTVRSSSSTTTSRCMWTPAPASTTDGSAYLTVQVSPLLIILCTCKCSSARYLPRYIYPVSSPCKSGTLNQIGRISKSQLMLMNRLDDPTPAPSMTMPTEHSSRPTLGFPLGTALLLLVIFSLSGIFSCCYHWDKLRSILQSRHPVMFEEDQHTVISIASSPSKTASDHKNEKAGKECGLPVIMPGDKVPKFFARPCPHEICLPEAEKNGVELQTKCSVSRNHFLEDRVHENTLN